MVGKVGGVVKRLVCLDGVATHSLQTSAQPIAPRKAVVKTFVQAVKG